MGGTAGISCLDIVDLQQFERAVTSRKILVHLDYEIVRSRAL